MSFWIKYTAFDRSYYTILVRRFVGNFIKLVTCKYYQGFPIWLLLSLFSPDKGRFLLAKMARKWLFGSSKYLVARKMAREKKTSTSPEKDNRFHNQPLHWGRPTLSGHCPELPGLNPYRALPVTLKRSYTQGVQLPYTKGTSNIPL